MIYNKSIRLYRFSGKSFKSLYCGGAWGRSIPIYPHILRYCPVNGDTGRAKFGLQKEVVG